MLIFISGKCLLNHFKLCWYWIIKCHERAAREWLVCERNACELQQFTSKQSTIIVC